MKNPDEDKRRPVLQVGRFWPLYVIDLIDVSSIVTID
jgi:hypothetical protein